MRTKVSSPDSLELALEMRKKERKKHRQFALFSKKQKELIQAYLIVSMDVLGLDR